jgi:Predicted integral membrane protein (DUF2269)
MSFSQHLVLWLHVAFVIFTIGPVTLAIMSTPRYIRQHDVRVVRYLSRITFIFMLGSLGVLIAGFGLASMLGVDGQWWIIVSATLFLVAVLLLALIVRDQRRAIRALEEQAAQSAALVEVPQEAATDEPSAPQQPPADSSRAGATHVASLERGRIAMIGGVVSVIWLVILVLMIWR